MNPYREPTAIANDAVAAQEPQILHYAGAGGQDIIGPLLLAGGGIVALAGAIFAHGTELALGGVAVMAAYRRGANYDR